MTLRAVAASVSAPPPVRSSVKNGKSDAELAIIAQLTVTDRHVRSHEQAHLAAAGPYATGGPSYIYQQLASRLGKREVSSYISEAVEEKLLNEAIEDNVEAFIAMRERLPKFSAKAIKKAIERGRI